MRHGFRVSVTADPGGVGQVNAAFAEFAEAHALPAAVRRSVNVALDDLLANAVSHGRTGREPCSVTVEVELDHISSAGLRILLGAAKHLRASGGTLGIFGVNQSVREVFEISGFASILSIYQSEAEALGAM